MTVMDSSWVRNHLPHRYPFLLVDKVVSLDSNKTLTAIKNVTVNEPFFNGHFPQKPIMPGVLIVEALAQACGILIFASAGQVPDKNSLYFLAGIENARFKQVVQPGDTVFLNVELMKYRRDVWKFQTHATVNDEIVCEASLTSVRRDIES
jgi:3-hydroxyacyl-[acyl-carrier-protein] dehydratase